MRAIPLLLALAPAAASAADWQPIWQHTLIDRKSVQPDGASAFTVMMKRTDVQADGMPPPADTILIRVRIDCAAHTNAMVDVTFFGKDGKALPGAQHNPNPPLLANGANSIPGRIEQQICPTLRGH